VDERLVAAMIGVIGGDSPVDCDEHNPVVPSSDSLPVVHRIVASYQVQSCLPSSGLER